MQFLDGKGLRAVGMQKDHRTAVSLVPLNGDCSDRCPAIVHPPLVRPTCRLFHADVRISPMRREIEEKLASMRWKRNGSPFRSDAVDRKVLQLQSELPYQEPPTMPATRCSCKTIPQTAKYATPQIRMIVLHQYARIAAMRISTCASCVPP